MVNLILLLFFNKEQWKFRCCSLIRLDAQLRPPCLGYTSTQYRCSLQECGYKVCLYLIRNLSIFLLDHNTECNTLRVHDLHLIQYISETYIFFFQIRLCSQNVSKGNLSLSKLLIILSRNLLEHSLFSIFSLK